MRALTLTQPWAGLVASGIKLVENRGRPIIKSSDIGTQIAIHASRVIDAATYDRIAEIARELSTRVTNEDGTFRCWSFDVTQPWFRLSRISSAVIAVATLDKEFRGGWTPDAIAQHSDLLSFSDGRHLGDQVRWFFGPVGYLLRDVIPLPTPVACRGFQGFWTLPRDVEAEVRAQL
jgi:hypothetical protein